MTLAFASGIRVRMRSSMYTLETNTPFRRKITQKRLSKPRLFSVFPTRRYLSIHKFARTAAAALLLPCCPPLTPSANWTAGVMAVRTLTSLRRVFSDRRCHQMLPAGRTVGTRDYRFGHDRRSDGSTAEAGLTSQARHIHVTPRSESVVIVAGLGIAVTAYAARRGVIAYNARQVLRLRSLVSARPHPVLLYQHHMAVKSIWINMPYSLRCSDTARNAIASR